MFSRLFNCNASAQVRRTLLNHRCLSGFTKIQQGAKYTPAFKQYLGMADGKTGSYFHDVPLDLSLSDSTVNMVVEIPRWSNAKFEISKETPLNPICQDTKKGKLRYVDNIFPFKGYMHNYGAIPQTWEDPTTEEFAETGLKGDNDPLDCCEIGSGVLKTGDIKKVKILGSLGLIDDGELDWKVIVIDTADPLAEKLDNLKDVEKHLPGLLKHTREWFRNYKIPQGKPKNEFAFDEKYLDRAKTMEIIQKCNASWNKLISNQLPGDFEDAPMTKRASDIIHIAESAKDDAPIPENVNTWHYV